MATILNTTSSVSSPDVHYVVDATTSNRTLNGITIKITVTSNMTGTSSLLGTGSTYGITGYIKLLGTEHAITIKSTSTKWEGQTKYTATKTIDLTGLNPTDTAITGITFRTTRSGNKNDGAIKDAGEIGATNCSNITFEMAHMPPTDVTYIMEETNQKLLDYGFPHDAIVENLSNKKFTISATLYDGANVQYAFAYNRINFHRVETTDNPATVYYDFGTNEIALDDEGLKVPIAVRITDSLGSGKFNNETNELAKAWDMYDYYPYNKITLIEIGTTAKRNGQISGKVKLNVNGTFYNGFIGSINQTDGYKPTIKYKFWALGDEEPTTYDYEVPSDNIDISENNFSVNAYEIGSSIETDTNWFNPESAYKVKIFVEDNFVSYESKEKTIALGESTWTEFRDRVDFKKITTKKMAINGKFDDEIDSPLQVYDDDGNLVSGSGNTYSTEEQRIGTWLGKPLYRKAYNFTTSSSALNMQIKIDNIDYDYITMTDKSVILDNIGNSKSMPMNYVTSTTFICRANVQYTSVAGWFVYFVYPSDVKNKKGIVVVEYTKTTD